MIINYIWAKLLKKARGNATKNFNMLRGSCIGSGNHIINSKLGKYSYLGNNCEIINCTIGNFCSISHNVVIGNSEHYTHWISTSPFFLVKRNPKDLKHYNNLSFADSKQTTIGNDVWIGSNVLIKQGVNIGNGVVIGMGSIVTKDIEDFSMVAGNPAKLIRKRFSEDMCDRIQMSEWWNLETDILKNLSLYADKPVDFLREIKNI